MFLSHGIFTAKKREIFHTIVSKIAQLSIHLIPPVTREKKKKRERERERERERGGREGGREGGRGERERAPIP